MLFKSQVYTQASGSVGGLTYSHNAAGMYTRSRTIPTNPATAQQQTVRNLMQTVAAAWSGVLTADQRAAWEVFAANVQLPGKLGDPITTSGIAHYVRCNVPRLQAGLSRVDDGPTVYLEPTLTPPTFTFTDADTISVAFTNTDDWANEVGGALLIYASRPQSVGTVFFKGPFRYANKVAGAGTPPTSPFACDIPFDVASGNKLIVQVRAVMADGRITSPFRVSGTRA